jgi:hypothetical protein
VLKAGIAVAALMSRAAPIIDTGLAFGAGMWGAMTMMHGVALCRQRERIF